MVGLARLINTLLRETLGEEIPKWSSDTYNKITVEGGPVWLIIMSSGSRGEFSFPKNKVDLKHGKFWSQVLESVLAGAVSPGVRLAWRANILPFGSLAASKWSSLERKRSQPPASLLTWESIMKYERLQNLMKKHRCNQEFTNDKTKSSSLLACKQTLLRL